MTVLADIPAARVAVHGLAVSRALGRPATAEDVAASVALVDDGLASTAQDAAALLAQRS